jgi:SAM-dependent methyltransferase
LKNSDRTRWEDLAQRQAYFPVLTDEGLLRTESSDIATAEFLATGEADISSVLAAAASVVGHDIALSSVLDFGCGAGRLTLPLARRATNVTACDISPTMLAHARQNADDAGLRNITYISNDQMVALPDGQFDFVCSLLVLQYVPRSSGYDIIRTLMRLLAPEGIAVLHLVLAPSGEPLRQLIRSVRAKSRLNRRSNGLDRDEWPTDAMRVYKYDEQVVRREIGAAGARILARHSADVGETAGAVLIIQKGPI